DQRGRTGESDRRRRPRGRALRRAGACLRRSARARRRRSNGSGWTRPDRLAIASRYWLAYVRAVGHDFGEDHRVGHQDLRVLRRAQDGRSHTDVLDRALLVLDTNGVTDAEGALEQQIN